LTLTSQDGSAKGFFYARIIAVTVALTLLSACGPDSGVTPVLRLEVQDVGFAEPALARTVNAFLGNAQNAPESSTGDCVAGRPETDGTASLSADDTLDQVDFRVRDLHEISAGMRFRVFEGNNGRIGLRVLAGRGRAKILLPDGVDIFVDAMTVTAKTRFFETAVTVEQSLSPLGIPSERFSVTAEAGHRHTKSEVSLRSALIRRDDTGTDNQTFLGAGLRVNLGPRHATRLDIGLRTLRGRGAIARLGIGHRF